LAHLINVLLLGDNFLKIIFLSYCISSQIVFKIKNANKLPEKHYSKGFSLVFGEESSKGDIKFFLEIFFYHKLIEFFCSKHFFLGESFVTILCIV